ncbi:g9502 [Coccomyxa elongata]
MMTSPCTSSVCVSPSAITSCSSRDKEASHSGVETVSTTTIRKEDLPAPPPPRGATPAPSPANTDHPAPAHTRAAAPAPPPVNTTHPAPARSRAAAPATAAPAPAPERAATSAPAPADHAMPDASPDVAARPSEGSPPTYAQRVHWARGARNDYTSALGTIARDNLIASHEAALGGHVDVAFETLDAGIRAAATSCGMPTVEKRDRAVHRAHAPFFDAECQALKRHVQAMANRCSNPSELRAMERRYHSLVRSKRRAYRVAQLKHLIDEQYANPRSFWKRLRGQNGKLPEQLRPVQSWDAYLQHLAGQPMLDVPPLPDMAYPVHPASDLQVTELNAPIRLGEVLEGLQKLHNGRAKGPQGLPSELLRYAKVESEAGEPPPDHVLAPALVAVLNCAFSEGRIPVAVSGSLVTPVFKRGDPGDPANYRPIAVTDAIMRLYANILYTRIVKFTEACGPQLRCGQRVPDLAYADDFVLMAATPAGLQRLLDAAVEFCQLVGMWVTQFDYLGVTFSAGSGMGSTFGKLHKNMWAA